MQQMSLWDDAPQDDTPPGCVRLPEMGGTIEWPVRWADGDTNPEQLERLARVSVGHYTSLKATNGEHITFRVIAARVEGDHVVETLQRCKSPIKSYVQWQREHGQAGTSDDGIE